MAERLRAEPPEWVLRNNVHRIGRTCRFGNFCGAFARVAEAAAMAEAEGHHPDVFFGWGAVTISRRTKKIKGLHENDFIVAAKLDRLTRGRDGRLRGRQPRRTDQETSRCRAD